ncbi:MAG: hypothetical protein P8X52_05960 [Limibacillus sp.]
MLFEIGRLEGHQRQQVIEISRHFLRALGLPRPDLWGDIVHQREGHARRAQPLGDPQAEVGHVDGEIDIRLKAQGGGGDLAHTAKYVERLGQHFDDPHDRELTHGDHALHALGFHIGAANAGEAHLAVRLALERRHQARTELIARRLTGDQEDVQVARPLPAHGRGNPRRKSP